MRKTGFACYASSGMRQVAGCGSCLPEKLTFLNLHTAQRELKEEAGLTAAHWQALGSFLSTPGFCDERIYLYLAQGLDQTDIEHHPHEVIEVHWIELGQALDWITGGDIVDGKTMLGLLLAAQLLAI